MQPIAFQHKNKKMLFAAAKSSFELMISSTLRFVHFFVQLSYKKKKPLARLFFLCYLDKIDALK